MSTTRRVIIPGHGPISNRRELSDYRDMIVTVGRRIREGVESGRNLEEVLASRPTAEFDARYGQGFMTPTRLVGNPLPGSHPSKARAQAVRSKLMPCASGSSRLQLIVQVWRRM